MRNFSLPICATLLALLCAGRASGEDTGAADLRMRLPPGEALRYAWAINSLSDSSGRERGRAFTLKADSSFTMNLLLRGLPGKRPVGFQTGEQTEIPVSIRIQDLTYVDKRAIEDSKTELLVSKSRVKIVENGKVLVDSQNDIGLDKLADYQEHIKNVESGEMRAVLDPAGKQGEIQGEPALVEAIKASGAQGIFPILAGKAVKPGEAWEDSFSMPKIGEFKLARPAVVRSKMTFAKWVPKDGKKLAQIELSSAWDKQDLKGENPDGLLVEITRVDGTSTGTCLFDPAAGQFVEGAINISMKYRIDGEKDGQTTGLDVTGQTRFTFTLQK